MTQSTTTGSQGEVLPSGDLHGGQDFDTFLRIWGAGGMLLVAISWRLWLPTSPFVKVPLIPREWLLQVGLVGRGEMTWDIVWSLAMACSLAIVIVYAYSPVGRWGLLLFVCAWASLVVTNMHRVQAWAYLWGLLAILFSSSTPSLAWRFARWLLISIYVYSAWSKLDFQFIHGLGEEFVWASVRPLGMDAFLWNAETRRGATLFFPLSELAIALGLTMARWRRIAGWIACIQHFWLMYLLGPFGLNQRAGVVVWNGVMVGVNYCLFVKPKSDRVTFRPGKWSAWDRCVAIVGVWVLVWPLFEPWDWIDHWPAWQLYAPRNSRVLVWVGSPDLDKLPKSLRVLADADRAPGPPLPHVAWYRLRIDRWSLEAVGVPIYPEGRFQAQIVQELKDRHGLEYLRVLEQGTSHRFTGARKSELKSSPAISNQRFGER